MPEMFDTADQKEISREDLVEYLESGNNPAAEEAIHALLEQSPEDAGLLNSLGSIYAQRGDYFNAEATFRKVIELNPEYGDAHYNLGLVYSLQSRKTEAIEKFIKAVDINPRDFAAHNDLGVLYHSQGKDLHAKSHFIKALEANILYKRALLNLFEVCWDADSYAEGLGWIEKYLSAAVPEFDSPDIETDAAPEQTTEPAIEETSEKKPEKIPAPGILKFTKKSIPGADDIFLKHIPAEIRGGKSGLNIAMVADQNFAGQMSLLFRMINRYTVHKARLIVLQNYDACYDKDLVLPFGDADIRNEAINIIEDADFYHLWGVPEPVEEVDWDKYLTSRNAVIQYYGPGEKADAGQSCKWHSENGIMGLICGDEALQERRHLFQQIDLMCDFSRIRTCAQPENVIRICHVPAGTQPGMDELFLSAVEDLKKKGFSVETVSVEGMTQEERLETKSRCHITFEQTPNNLYGLSVIESMAAGHAVICGVSNFVSSRHADNPIVYVTEENLLGRLGFLLQNRREIARLGNSGRIWAWRNHDPMKLIRQYTWIYDMVMEGCGSIADRDRYLLR